MLLGRQAQSLPCAGKDDEIKLTEGQIDERNSIC
jgi:hypothetical protein